MSPSSSSPWSAWSNDALIRDAAAIARRHATLPDDMKVFIWTGTDDEARAGVGPCRLMSTREMFRTHYAYLRAERRETFETPPGVGV